jgi:hypothetical protein
MLLKFISRGRKMPWQTAMTLIVALAALSLGLRFATYEARFRGPVPVTPQLRKMFLTARFPMYPIYESMNKSFGKNYKVYDLHADGQAYFVDGVMLGGAFGDARYGRILYWDGVGQTCYDGQTVYDVLHGLGAEFLVVGSAGPRVILPNDAAFRQHFERIGPGVQGAGFRATIYFIK